MGQEIKTTLRMDGRILEGTAQLAGGALHFKGAAVTLQLPYGEIFSVEESAGWLDLKTSRGLLLLELGPKASRWAQKIKSPGAFLEKLGVDATKKVAVVGKLDPEVKEELDASGAKVAKRAGGKDFDVVFLAVSAKPDLEKLPSAREMIHDTGAVWVVYPKNVEEDVLRERDVIIAGRTLSLTDGKPLKLDEDLMAIRFVVPASARKRK